MTNIDCSNPKNINTEPCEIYHKVSVDKFLERNNSIAWTRQSLEDSINHLTNIFYVTAKTKEEKLRVRNRLIQLSKMAKKENELIASDEYRDAAEQLIITPDECRCKGVGNSVVTDVLATAYLQYWVGTEEFKEADLDKMMAGGLLEGKKSYIGQSKLAGYNEVPRAPWHKSLKTDRIHYGITWRGIGVLHKCTNFDEFRGTGSAIDTRKIRMTNKH